MTMTLSRPTKRLTLVSVRHVYRCREYPRWRIERSHITAGEGADDAYPDRWQVWRQYTDGFTWQLWTEHRTKAAAAKAMARSIRAESRP